MTATEFLHDAFLFGCLLGAISALLFDRIGRL